MELEAGLPEISPGVKRWLNKPVPVYEPGYGKEPSMTSEAASIAPAAVPPAAAAPEPTVTVPVSSTNLVISQLFTEVMTGAQVIGGVVLGSVLNDPSAITSLTHGWPGWLSVMVIAGLQWIKRTYFAASNAATVAVVASMEKPKT